ncbi:MAG: SpoIIE family protein phosphatase [Vicinamibacterales bacterium]
MTSVSSAPGTESPAVPHAIRVLLVDDQAMVGEAVRRMLASDPDVEFLYCADPTRAMQMAAEFGPTVILQDLVMPEVDGLTMLRYYRANPATREIPTIVLSTKEEPKVKAEAFTLGASDYLVKLPDPIELGARVRMHSRGYIAQLERNEAYAALKRSEERLAEELEQAAKYLTSLLPNRLTGPIIADWEFIPSAELGGDTFGYSWLDDDHFAMYLLDVCGHGLKAALLSISAMNVLRNQTLPSTDFRSPASVLSGMNEAFQMDRHNNMYFTMWYGVFNRANRTLTYANGGHPPAVLLAGASPAEATPTELARPGMIIGGFPGMDYEEGTVDLPAFSRVYFFSDGVYEITRPDGSMLSLPEFVTILAGGPRDRSAIPHAIEAIRAVRGPHPFEDDVSIVEATL